MTPLWHDGALDTLAWDGAAPVVWRVADGDADGRHRHAAALVARLAGTRIGAVTLARTAAGAPRVAQPAGWHLGLSRRSGGALVAVARRPIAVDRELVDDAPPLWDMLTAREAEAIAALPPPARPRAWLRRWTIKEAHAKLIGEPRRIAPERIATRVIDPVRAAAGCEGVSRCWTHDTGDAIETVAIWARRA
ncbi:4'-phosphopantetheinyl transferase family protein [Sphingomonas sp. CLY1604]|uniref:4'-phosphopantetheinyl transferase family protein n=1 Tax=Sphingomonas sp. CLY1604 TaxID=3457786 RepID=UPI003FD774C4